MGVCEVVGRGVEVMEAVGVAVEVGVTVEDALEPADQVEERLGLGVAVLVAEKKAAQLTDTKPSTPLKPVLPPPAEPAL